MVIKNKSAWDIRRIYISSVDADSWGEGRLDEDGDQCELRNVKLCNDNIWTIDNDELLGCERNN